MREEQSSAKECIVDYHQLSLPINITPPLLNNEFDENSIKEAFDLKQSEQNGSKINITKKKLKQLSLKVWQIVQKCKCTTFKQIINNLLRVHYSDELGSVKPKKLKKIQKNIKKRVYDVLNTLIQINRLKKNGKFITINQQQLLQQRNDQKRSQTQVNVQKESQTLFAMKEKLNRIEKLVMIKKEKVRKMYNIKQNLSQIIKRNQNVQQNQELQEKKVLFPFIAICFEKELPQICHNKFLTYTIPILNNTEVFADLDLLDKIRIDTLNQCTQKSRQQQIKEDIEEIDKYFNF